MMCGWYGRRRGSNIRCAGSSPALPGAFPPTCVLLVLDPYIRAAPNSYQPVKKAPTRVPEALQEEVVHDRREARAHRVKGLCRGQAGGRAEGSQQLVHPSLPLSIQMAYWGWPGTKELTAHLAQRRLPALAALHHLGQLRQAGGSVGSLIIKELARRSVWHPGWQLAAGLPQPSSPPARGAVPCARTLQPASRSPSK